MKEIIDVFKSYGFEFREEISTKDAAVLVMTQGIFNNALIVKSSEFSDVSELSKDLSDSGYSVRSFFYKTHEECDLELFRGFFKVSLNKERFKRSYKGYVERVCDTYACDTERYRYISAPFNRADMNCVDEFSGGDVIERILSDIDSDGPGLIIVEAAAGFGKTSTAYEIGRFLAERSDDILPFMAELSRDRKARIFKHILHSEIERSFPSLLSHLVVKQIIDGRVVVILDGFDELLRGNEAADDFEGAEAMLETIGEILKGRAKVILTTRRTSILEGDEFHKWIASHESDFSVVRYGILEPRIDDWLESERAHRLEEVGVSIRNIANPVILNYLRLATESDFDSVLKSPDGIIRKYFLAMLERERERQDLRMRAEDQSSLLARLAGDMVINDYSRADKDYLINYFLQKEQDVIDVVRLEYSVGERPARDEVAHKLFNHALLDRGSAGNKVGFINDFVLGNYVAEDAIKYSDGSWFGDEKFIDAAITSYLPRGYEEKERLWEKFLYVSEALRAPERLGFESSLLHRVVGGYDDQTFSDMEFSDVCFMSDASFDGATFFGCIFSDCKFYAGSFAGAGFINCTFYRCLTEGDVFLSDMLSCQIVDGDMSGFMTPDLNSGDDDGVSDGIEEENAIKRSILELFWPRGKEAITFGHIPILAMYKKGYPPRKINDIVDKFRKDGVFVDAKRKNWVGIDKARISEIAIILGR